MTSWPTPLAPATLGGIVDMPTPYLVTDLDTVAARHASFRAALPGGSNCGRPHALHLPKPGSNRHDLGR